MAIGDHLYIQYPTFQHHGIELGDGTVIEYGGKGSGFLSIRRVALAHFLSRGPAYVVQYAPGASLPPEQTVRLATSRLSEQLYDVLDNNCEHFAFWCKTGRHMSPQADSVKDLLKIGAVIGVIALIAAKAS